jgi:hypothetical protein
MGRFVYYTDQNRSRDIRKRNYLCDDVQKLAAINQCGKRKQERFFKRKGKTGFLRERNLAFTPFKIDCAFYLGIYI